MTVGIICTRLYEQTAIEPLIQSGTAMPAPAELSLCNAKDGDHLACELLESMDPFIDANNAHQIAAVRVDIPELLPGQKAHVWYCSAVVHNYEPVLCDIFEPWSVKGPRAWGQRVSAGLPMCSGHSAAD